MTEPSTPVDDPLPPQPRARAETDIELVCGHCGHAFRTPFDSSADHAASLRCPACRKAFKMNERFAHDALEEIEKRRRPDPIDQVLAELGKILRG